MRLRIAALFFGCFFVAAASGAGGMENAPAPRNLSVAFGKVDAGFSGTKARWWGGVKAPDGKIYGCPYGADEILVVDPASGTATGSAMGAELSGTGKWASGTLGPDGKIYCVPYDAPDVLIIDPAAGTAVRTDFGLDLAAPAKWAGAVLGTDRKIYAIPRSSTAS